ncbi:hypothetical protein ACHAWC_003749 [Mediolabrus comicus]
MMSDGTPLKDIEEHRDQDVLCGRGGGTNHHVGNAHWRKLVNSNKRLYISLPKKQKALVAKSIVHAIRAQNPPGRFLARNPKNSLWCDIGDQKATEKTSQALREGAPDIRIKMAKEGQMGEMGSDLEKGKVLPNGLIGLERTKPGEPLPAFTESTGAPDAAKMPITVTDQHANQSSRSELPSTEASMMMAFQQYLGGQNPYSKSQPTTDGPKSSTPQSNAVPTTVSSNNSLIQPPFESLAPKQLKTNDDARELHNFRTARPINDVQVNQNNAHLNLGNGKMMTNYNEVAQRAALEAEFHEKNRAAVAAAASKYQPGQLASGQISDLNYGRLAVNNSVPTNNDQLGSTWPQLMTNILRNSSISSATGLGTTFTANNFTNNMLGNATGRGTTNNFANNLLGNVTGKATVEQNNTLARFLEHQKQLLLNNPLLGNTMASRLDQQNLSSMSSLGRLPHQPLPSDLGMYADIGMPGLTSLQPSASTALAQMKIEELLNKQRRKELSAPETMPHRQDNLDSATAQLNSFQEHMTAVSIPKTSAARRGTSGASLDDLVMAADLHSRVNNQLRPAQTEDDDDDEKSQREFYERVVKKRRTSKQKNEKLSNNLPKLGVNDSSLVDDDSDEEANMKFKDAKRKRPKSDGLQKSDSLARGVSLNRLHTGVSFSQKIKSLPLAETTFDRGHSLAMSEISLDRGQSLGGTGFMGEGNDGQFDDASEDEGQIPTFVSKTKSVERGCTIGTFPMDII